MHLVRPSLRNLQRCIHRGFDKWKMKDDDKKKFIPQLTIDTEYSIFIAHLPILVRCETKGQLERCAPYCGIGKLGA